MNTCYGSYAKEKNSFVSIFLTTMSMVGKIKKLTEKGFGFITGEGLEKDLFFHSNSLVGITFAELREGDSVTFETAESPKGLNAVNVQIAKGGEAEVASEPAASEPAAE
ncbi:MAG: cold shock domain-containing protein [Candidatus Gracilibacteria bacterium]